MNGLIRVLGLGGLLLLQACASKGPAQPVDRDIFLFGSYPVYVQQQICTTTRSGTATLNPPAPDAVPAAPAATSTLEAARNGRSGQGTLTADQQRIQLSVQERRYGCYADRRRSRANLRGIYLAPYGSVAASALVTAADFRAAANLAAIRSARRARAQLDANASISGLAGGVGLRGGPLR